MNPTELKFNITPIVVMILGLIAALSLGAFIGGGDLMYLGIIFGAAALIALASLMRQNIWILIPMFWGFIGSVRVLPIPFSVRDLAVMLVTGTGCALFALRRFKFRNKWDSLDLILFLNILQLGLAFLFNPAGLKSLSSQIVGARPYFNVLIGIFAYFILSNQALSVSFARRIPILMVLTELVSAGLFLLSRASQSIGFALGRVYDAYLPPTYLSGVTPTFERMTGSVRGGTLLITALCSFFRPITVVNPLYFRRFFLLLLGLVLVLVSGFRSQLLTIAVIFLLASYFRHGWTDALISIAGMLGGALFLIIFNSAVHPLPISVQRSLSALPGEWDSRAIKDAEGSTEWRLDMWKDVPKGTRYIHNKLMGDGFGFSQAELSAMERQTFFGGDITPEDFLIIGAFHNGPLSTIRFVGAIGLVLYYTLLIYLAVFAWRLIRITQGTDFFPFALFVGLAVIWEPVYYTFVFGAFDSGFPNALFNAGMLKLLYNSLPEHALTTSKEPSTPALPRLAEYVR